MKHYPERIADLGRGVLEDLDRDIDRIFTAKVTAAGYAEIYLSQKTLTATLARLVGPHPGHLPYTAIQTALRMATERITHPVQREAAQVMLGLTKHPYPTTYSDRLHRVVALYVEHEMRRRSRPVIGRAEIPELRFAVVQGLALLHSEFAQGRRGDPLRRKRETRQAEALSWETYAQHVRDIVGQLSYVIDDDPDDWAILGVSRGGLPLAVHLSHALSLLSFGTASVWKPPPSQEQTQPVPDGLYGPIRGLDGRPGRFLLVDDVVTHGRSITALSTELVNHYGQDVQVWQVSLFRDLRLAAGTTQAVYAADFDSRETWWVLPWEA